ncbi:MAG: 30S ribosomal protein S12 methylthiotransferase RimO [Acidobacteria bacterium]|nr:30S ribosomal protein S12 methylthiotransferase RimO [Acidobacteriota bacterium]
MKIGFLSLGCPKNLVDSEVMVGLLQQAGHKITNRAADAEVIVVNTCAFIDSAKQESIDAILEMAEHKRTGACRRLVVTGCLAERYRDELGALLPEIDVTLGTGEVPEIVGAVASTPATAPGPAAFFRSRPDAEVSAGGAVALPRRRPTYLYDAETPRTLATPRHFAYVKIAEGCDYACAFCIIPQLRGAYRSRPSESILHEARALADRGVRELILISQDTTFYGIDRGERGALASLLRRLNTIDGIDWIRLLYLYPTTMTDETLAAVAESDKVCKYIDLPLQHASARVLGRMRRPGNRATYERLVTKIRRRIPHVTLRTTFIVGFPGETPGDFDELRQFMMDVCFDHVGVFTYSHEEGTSAYGLEDDVPMAVKDDRCRALMGAQKKIVAAAQSRRLGEHVRVLIDGRAEENGWVLQGRLEAQAPEIDPVVYLTECDPSAYRAGEMIDAEIVAAREYDLLVRPRVESMAGGTPSRGSVRRRGHM